METTPKKWVRWTELTKEFPKPKYGFTEYLKRIGDYVETFPMNDLDCDRIKHAAKAWAYFHGYRVKIKKIKAGDGMSNVRITLASKTREREDEY